MNNKVTLKPVSELLGMNFLIPDYQRGYRWGKQQVIDLLEDINNFAERNKATEKIYCIQPLVVSEKKEDILAKCKSPDATLEDIKKYIKGSWNVVDGQQRLTTIYLLLRYLNSDDLYEIDYCTRVGSKDFLSDIQNKNADEANDNIDFYHMHLVYSIIKEWFNAGEQKDKEKFKETLLNKVNFIWYQIDGTDEITVFTRLNIGKIPLTDSELIKALFLNRTNFGSYATTDLRQIEILQQEIAVGWDKIENTLQNDEFWAFIHDTEYCKPTRIDFILDSICKKDGFGLYKELGGLRGKNREEAFSHNKKLDERIGNDEHKTFRYFNEKFKFCKDYKQLAEIWQEVEKYYQVFTEWYQDYRLYHYIGYLTCISSSIDIADYVSKWDETKEGFINTLRDNIVEKLKKKTWIKELKTYKFDQDGNKSKGECADILLLHNIETIIQQNEKLVSESKYNLPNFSKFPFHLYKKEKWQVEHIRPNAGDNFKKSGSDKLYLSLAGKCFSENNKLISRIDKYIRGNSSETDFTELVSEIIQQGGLLSDDDKNKIWNYVLLDETTNKEYGNQIFPVKRKFIINKENGKKIKYSFENGELQELPPIPEVAFVPPCTKNVFSKLYTPMPTTLINWNEEDAQAYFDDIKDKLKYYFDEIDIQ